MVGDGGNGGHEEIQPPPPSFSLSLSLPPSPHPSYRAVPFRLSLSLFLPRPLTFFPTHSIYSLPRVLTEHTNRIPPSPFPLRAMSEPVNVLHALPLTIPFSHLGRSSPHHPHSAILMPRSTNHTPLYLPAYSPLLFLFPILLCSHTRTRFFVALESRFLPVIRVLCSTPYTPAPHYPRVSSLTCAVPSTCKQRVLCSQSGARSVSPRA